MMKKDWDDLVDPARVALEALVTSGDDMADRIEGLEAKLAEAVEALSKIATDGDPFGWIASNTLAELKGESE